MTAETKAMTYRKGKIHDMSLDLLHRDLDRPRKHFDESELDALQ